MSKEEMIRISGKIMESLPNAMFKVELENGEEVLCTVSGKMRKFNIRAIVGDQVDIELSPYDLTRGRIVLRK